MNTFTEFSILVISAFIVVYYFCVGSKLFSEYSDAYETKKQFFKGLIPFYDWAVAIIYQFKQLN